MPALFLCVSCTCAPRAVEQYLGRVSGPLLDRIDLHMEVLPVEYEKLSSSRPEESSASVRQRVMEARKRQAKRFAGTGISCNAQIPPALLKGCCPLEPAAEKLLAAAHISQDNALLSTIDGALKVELREGYKAQPIDHDLALYVEFASREAEAGYRNHPKHVQFKEFIKALERVCIDTEV